MCIDWCEDGQGWGALGVRPFLCMTPYLLWEVDYQPPQHTCPQIAAGGQSTRDQPSECLQPSRHYLMSLWDVPVKWCFLRLLLQEARVRLHDLQFHRQCEVITNSVKPVWSSILLSLPSPGRGEASGRRERAGYFFFFFSLQQGPPPCPRLRSTLGAPAPMWALDPEETPCSLLCRSSAHPRWWLLFKGVGLPWEFIHFSPRLRRKYTLLYVT